MVLSPEARHAIAQMRFFLQLEEEHRASVTEQYHIIKEKHRELYQRTNRETFGALEATVTQIANADPVRKSIVGDEQFARSLAEMYAQVAAVEISLCVHEVGAKFESGPSLRNVNASRVK